MRPRWLVVGVLATGWPLQVQATAAVPPPRESDTVRVAPPTGGQIADRASILAALDEVGEGGTVLFAPGTYEVGPILHVTTPRITLLGHPDGTILRGCDPDEYPPEPAGIVASCNGLDLAAGHQTVRGLTFEHAWHAVVLGGMDCGAGPCEPFGEPVSERPGGHRVEESTFRNVAVGVRSLGEWPEPAVVRGNRFTNTFHAVVVHGSTVHVVENEVSVPAPEGIPATGHAGGAILVSATDLNMQLRLRCACNLIAGNRVAGHTDGVGIAIFRPDVGCRDNIIRNNTIAVKRVRVPPGSWIDTLVDEADSMAVGIPIELVGTPAPYAEFFADAFPDLVPSEPSPGGQSFLEGTVVEGNRIFGAEGLGIAVLGASGTRIVDNTITGIRRREPFPGRVVNSVDAEEAGWHQANGSAVWLSRETTDTEVSANRFRSIEGSPVVDDGDGNRVDTSPGTLADSIRVLVETNMATISRGDAPAWLALFAEDARWAFLATAYDRSGIERMAHGLAGVDFRVRILAAPLVTVLGHDAATAFVTVEEYLTGPEGEQAGRTTALTLVYQRQDGEWKVVHVHESWDEG